MRKCKFSVFLKNVLAIAFIIFVTLEIAFHSNCKLTYKIYLIIYLKILINYIDYLVTQRDIIPTDIEILELIPTHLKHFLNTSSELNLNTNISIHDNYQNLNKIKRLINKINRYQIILNEKKFGPIKEDSVVIVVQVKTF